ncbi:MAG: crotonase/enoyl-CoA hydratase family protein [Burkholderiaceae bacterium]
MNDRVRITIDNGVADVRLVRADKLNALDQAMFEALVQAGAQLRADPSVRAVVLSGEGRAFCAGIDLGRIGAGGAEASGSTPAPRRKLTPRTHGITNTAQQAAWTWRELPVPVIAAVHGVAFGGGFQVMLGADMRYLAPDTRLSIMEIKWGLVPDMAGTVLMRHLARDDIIRELTYTGRIFGAQQALDYGFATRVCDEPHAAALATAREIAARRPSAIVAAKRIFNPAASLDEAAAMLLESREQEQLMGADNQLEAIRAEVAKRPAVFANAR